MKKTVLVLTTLMMLLGSAGLAQEVSLGTPKDTTPPPPGGTVSGRVVFADTNGPARFAKVLLKSTQPSDGGENPFSALIAAAGADAKPGKAAPKLSAADEAEKKQAQAASSKMMGAISDLLVSTTIAADGTYTFTNVKAGTYYVHAMAPGYIDPLGQFSADELASTDPAVRQRIAAVIPTITVNGTEQARADLRLARGASISGRVLYDDGTPAVGWTVRIVHDAPAGATTPATFSAMGLDAADMDLTHIAESAQTNDLGQFRISGLAGGEYVLQARFSGPALGHSSFNPIAGGGMAALQGLKLGVYSGNALHRKDATTISVKSGEERNGVDIAMPLRQTHAVAGLVRSQADGHPVSAGSVELTAQDAQGNPDTSVHLMANVQADGTFRVDYVPNGMYTVKVSHAADVTTKGVTKMFGSMIADQKTTHKYGPANSTVMVGDGDVTDVKVEVPEVAAN